MGFLRTAAYIAPAGMSADIEHGFRVVARGNVVRHADIPPETRIARDSAAR